MASIYIESLSKEYQRKLRERKLELQTIESLAASISKKHLQKKRALKKAALLCAIITILLAVMTVLAPTASAGSRAAMIFAFLIVILMEVLILVLAYVAVCRVPRQFSKCLKAGYPELVIKYGYEQIVNGSLAEPKPSRQLPFSMGIEDIFRLQDSDDIVVVGFVHGLIRKGNAVHIIDKNDPSKGHAVTVVSAIELTNKKKVLEAADCIAALRLKDGTKINMNLVPGMYLYREVE